MPRLYQTLSLLSNVQCKLIRVNMYVYEDNVWNNLNHVVSWRGFSHMIDACILIINHNIMIWTWLIVSK